MTVKKAWSAGPALGKYHLYSQPL